MSVYLNVDAAQGNPVNFLGITDGETAIVAGLAAVVAVLIVLGVLTGGAIILGLLAIVALYGVLYGLNNITGALGNALSGVYSGLANMLKNLGIANPEVADILITVIIAVIVCLLAYAGYYIYENV